MSANAHTPESDPPLIRPSWADVYPLDAWDEDVATGDLVTIHEKHVGTVARVSVSVVQEVFYRDGGLVEGEHHVYVSECMTLGLTPDEAAELGRIVLVASVEARRLREQP